MQTTKTNVDTTAGGIEIHRASIDVDYADATAELISRLDAEPGVLLSSGCEVPGRYARWDLGCEAGAV